jgi:aconitate hydratase
VAYAIAGNVNLDLSKDPIGKGKDGKDVFLKDIWPSGDEVAAVVQKHVTAAQFTQSYSDVFKGDANWQGIQVPKGELYQWDKKSTYIKEPPFFDGLTATPPATNDIKKARVLALLGDSVTTDHISPAGSFKADHPAGKYLVSLGVKPKDFNSYGARRGNHEVMVRGTFANIRLKNFLVPGVEGGVTTHFPSNQQMSIFDASEKYQGDGVPLMVIAGKEYGTGSSRDWAAKGPKLLGIRVVIAESFERIHRSNLVGMGILPLQFKNGESAKSLGLSGKETFDIENLGSIQPGSTVKVKATAEDGSTKTFEVRSRIDTPNEVEYFKHGGILPYVLRQAVK